MMCKKNSNLKNEGLQAAIIIDTYLEQAIIGRRIIANKYEKVNGGKWMRESISDLIYETIEKLESSALHMGRYEIIEKYNGLEKNFLSKTLILEYIEEENLICFMNEGEFIPDGLLSVVMLKDIKDIRITSTDINFYFINGHAIIKFL